MFLFIPSMMYTRERTRRTYTNFDELREDLLFRIGRSILNELSDEELADLVAYIQGQLHRNDEQAIVERDRWTVWSAQKGEQ